MPEYAGSRSEALGFLVRTEAGRQRAGRPDVAVAVDWNAPVYSGTARTRSPAISRGARIHRVPTSGGYVTRFIRPVAPTSGRSSPQLQARMMHNTMEGLAGLPVSRLLCS